ncbi:MAG: Amidohydro-rel domain-containing protein [Burkholderia sp.]|jgi:hypothetical protein
MWDRLLKNARVVDPVNRRDGVMDVAVAGGRIAAVGPALKGEAKETEDLSGLVLMPGMIDPHLHLGSMFGSSYGTRMAALAGVTTCLDMAGPVDEILDTGRSVGAGINVAMLEGFSPMKHCGTMTPDRKALERFVSESVAKGAIGVKIMGGHWPLPLETSEALVRTANDMGAYVAWHAGSLTAGSNILGMREVIERCGDAKLHLAHINAYCRGRVNPVLDEALEALKMLREHPSIWCEAYVSPNNGTVLDCDENGQVTDHVTQTCLKTFGLTPDAQGIKQAILRHQCFYIADNGFTSVLTEGEEALALFEKNHHKGAGSFPVNPALSRFVIAQAKRSDGSFVVDAISTDGGCIPRNVQIAVGLSLVRFGALTMPEFVVKTSVNPARHLRLKDRGHLSDGAAADITVFDAERQKAIETIVGGRTVMKNGSVTGKGMTVITTEAGKAHVESLGYPTIITEFASPEPERFIP